MRALLSSAEERSREREGNSGDRGDDRFARKNSGREGTRNNNNDGRRSRWGDRGGTSRHHHRNDQSEYNRKRPLDGEYFREADRGAGAGAGRPNRIEDENSGDRKHSGDSNQKNNENDSPEPPPPEFKPNFGLSGALAKDQSTGNVYKGVQLKFREPPEARAPNTQWRLYVFKPKTKGSDNNNKSNSKSKDGDKSKDDDLIDTLHISKQSAYLFGRNSEIADVPLLHPSLSGQHAVLQYRAVPSSTNGKLSCRPYLMDLESTNGTFLNGVRLDAARYYELKKGDVLRFGASTREYVLLTEHTTAVGSD